ncbi:GyrI-like domain-containing protein [Undibacterium sp. TJN19]|uniref:GyrI-like domain-containing protein n=1 Tax=Undibacterium sp. TJN19 TaxID=3413055 RepID=UPI003BF2B486
MLSTPEILDLAAQQTAVIRLTIKREECPQEMRPAITELMAALAEQGITPVGPLFSHHLSMPSAIFDFEVGVPVNAVITATGRVMPSQLPASKVARTVYQGSYEGLGAAWGEFATWISVNDNMPAPSLWECYLAGPESGGDATQWRTQLNRPLLA